MNSIPGRLELRIDHELVGRSQRGRITGSVGVLGVFDGAEGLGFQDRPIAGVEQLSGSLDQPFSRPVSKEARSRPSQPHHEEKGHYPWFGSRWTTPGLALHFPGRTAPTDGNRAAENDHALSLGSHHPRARLRKPDIPNKRGTRPAASSWGFSSAHSVRVTTRPHVPLSLDQRRVT